MGVRDNIDEGIGGPLCHLPILQHILGCGIKPQMRSKIPGAARVVRDPMVKGRFHHLLDRHAGGQLLTKSRVQDDLLVLHLHCGGARALPYPGHRQLGKEMFAPHTRPHCGNNVLKVHYVSLTGATWRVPA